MPSSATAWSTEPAWRVLDPKPDEVGGVATVDRCPAVLAVADVARGAVAAVGVDDPGDEAVVAGAVDRGCEADAHRPHAPLGEREQGQLRGGARAHLIGRHVLLGGDPAGLQAGDARGDGERPAAASEHLAEDFDRGAIGRGGLLEAAGPGDVVAEGEVDDAVGLLGARPQDVDVLDVAAQDLGAGRGHPVGGGVRAGEADNLVAVGEEFGNDGRSDPTRCAGDEYTHDQTSWGRGAVRSNMLRGRRDVSGCHQLSTACQRLSSRRMESVMSRWKPDAAGRLQQAAFELYAERGYEETTVAEIAERAGLTERTFFRHFGDKREVLFRGSGELERLIVDAVGAAPASATPIEAVTVGIAAAGAMFDATLRPYSLQRQAVIDANPELQERETVKLASLAAALAEALRRRGVQDPAAGLTAEAGVAVFRVAFEHWVHDDSDRDYAWFVHDAIAELRTVTAG